MRLRPVLAVALAALAFAAPREAAAAGGDLEKAHNAYIAHQYDEAEARLRALLDPATGTLKDPDSIADARMYLGATLVAEKKTEEAAAVLALLLSDKPDYQPDPLRVSLDAIDAFTDARERNRDKLAALQAARVRRAQEERARAEADRQKEALRITMLEKIASTEIVTETHSRALALVPFGAGQFQNGQTALAWTLLVGEGLLAMGSGVGAAVWYFNIGQRDATLAEPSVAYQYNQRAQQAAVVGDVLAGGFALVALVGVIHAEATFVPEVTTTRPRALPPVSLTPLAGPGVLGLRGSF